MWTVKIASARPFALTVLLAAGAVVSPGCSGAGEVRPDDDLEKLPPTHGMGPIHEAAKPGERVIEFDLNRDEKPDVWTYAISEGGAADGGELLRTVRKEIDLNADGRVDIRRRFDDREVLTEEALDLDFDGRVDTTHLYERNVLVRKERDLNFDDRSDLFLHFEKGRLVRKERDSNFDGKVDYWEYWENDAIQRIGEDLDGDGKVDRWTQNPG